MSIYGTGTSAFYARSRFDMAALRSQAEKTQGQLSSGKRLERSSDDPVAASRLRTLDRQDRLGEVDVSNTNRAAGCRASTRSHSMAVMILSTLAHRGSSDVARRAANRFDRRRDMRSIDPEGVPTRTVSSR